jgi:uncharacterized protein with PIN domain
MQFRFIADVHLGRLAKLLRMLGFDTFYQNNISKATLLKIAVAKNRVVLSRNASLATNPFIQTCIINDENPNKQLQQVIQHFALQQHLKPYTRCLVCNAMLEVVEPTKIWDQLPENTRLHFQEFWQCLQCQRVYWKGSHYDRMEAWIRKLINLNSTNI